MAITINELETGMGLVVDGQLFFVTELNHVKPGKGSAFVRVRLKNIRTDAVLERTYRTAETLEEADLERRRMQFTYVTGDEYHFMDQSSFEDTIITFSSNLSGFSVGYSPWPPFIDPVSCQMLCKGIPSISSRYLI